MDDVSRWRCAARSCGGDLFCPPYGHEKAALRVHQQIYLIWLRLQTCTWVLQQGTTVSCLKSLRWEQASSVRSNEIFLCAFNILWQVLRLTFKSLQLDSRRDLKAIETLRKFAAQNCTGLGKCWHNWHRGSGSKSASKDEASKSKDQPSKDPPEPIDE